MQGNNTEFRTIVTKNSYEASYYMMYGARLAKVRKIMLNDREASKKGFRDQWAMTIDNVPINIIETWRTGLAYGNITKFVDVRTKLKKTIKRELSNSC